MPNYRVFYVERTPKDDSTVSLTDMFERAPDDFEETDWEETYDGHNAEKALAGFFQDHAADGAIQIMEEDGSSRDVGGNEAFDPDRTYVWVEDGHMMEYQGMDEATPGMVSCPMCDGTGEVEEAVAEGYLAGHGAAPASGEQWQPSAGQ